MKIKEAAKLRAFIRLLEMQDQLLLILAYAEQMTYAEIGLVLDMTERLVEERHTQLLTRARASIVDVKMLAICA